jgi:hypothetical protein
MEVSPAAPERALTRAVKMPVIDRLASAVITAVPPILVAIGM